MYTFLTALALLVSFASFADVTGAKRRITDMCEAKAQREASFWTSEAEVYNTCVHNAKINFYSRTLNVMLESRPVVMKLIEKSRGEKKDDYTHDLRILEKNIKRQQSWVRSGPGWLKDGRYGSSDLDESRDVVETYLQYELEHYRAKVFELRAWRAKLRL